MLRRRMQPERDSWLVAEAGKRTQSIRHGTAGYMAGSEPKLAPLPDYLLHHQPREGSASAASDAHGSSNCNN